MQDIHLSCMFSWELQLTLQVDTKSCKTSVNFNGFVCTVQVIKRAYCDCESAMLRKNLLSYMILHVAGNTNKAVTLTDTTSCKTVHANYRFRFSFFLGLGWLVVASPFAAA